IYRTDQISDTALTDMTDFFKTLTKPVTFTAVTYQPKPGDDPAKVLFNQKQCATCHGENADRILAQTLRATNRTTLTQDDIEKQLRNPRRNMPMFSEQLFSKADVTTIAPWMKAAAESALLTPPPSAPGGTPGAQATAAGTSVALQTTPVATTAPTTAPTRAATIAPTTAPATTAPTRAAVATTAPTAVPTQTAGDAASNLLPLLVAALLIAALIGGYYYLRRNPR
ncbi:MAG: cytochrome c, partial [Chloroflexi bacterium]|nr:cytochrome c [Chloroflexota bacterium]